MLKPYLSNLRLGDTAFRSLMTGAFATVIAYMLYRLIGVYPHVFADEWYYSKMSRLQPLSDSILPSWLYLWLYRGSSACGNAFYDCAHAANVGFYALASLFIFLTARIYVRKRIAALIALFAILAPSNIYTAYFMPEPMYYCGFTVLGWIALAKRDWHWTWYALACGGVLGLMALVKVHALFLLPGLSAYMLYTAWAASGKSSYARGAGSVALLLAGCFFVKFGLGYLLAGDAALNLFGNFYQGAANAAARTPLTLLAPAFVSARGHAMALAILVPLPLAILAGGIICPPEREQVGQSHLLKVFVFLMVASAVGLTVFYTASVASPGVTNEGLRLHLRYYSFTLPFLWLVAAGSGPLEPQTPNTKVRWSIAFLLIVALAFALLKLQTYALNPVDGPEVLAINPVDLVGQLSVFLAMAVLLLWATGKSLAKPLFIFGILPLSLTCGFLKVDREIDSTKNMSLSEVVNNYARAVVPPSERSEITVAGADRGQMMHVQFQLDNAQTSLLELPPSEPLEEYQLPSRKKWLIVLGDYSLPQRVHPLVKERGFSIARLSTGYRRVGEDSFAKPFGHGLIHDSEGLSSVEPWGRWSDSAKVVLHFRSALPRHLRVVLNARAYDVNADLPFVLHVGKWSTRFKVGWQPQDLALFIETDGLQRELVIDVPHPVAPTERGELDPRKLGIGISSIEIDELTSS